MRTILDELHADHLNFTKLLDLLKHYLGILRERDLPDFLILLDTIDYLQNYGDLYHHPREDLIFRLYRERSSEAIGEIEELERQHGVLGQSTDQLRLAIEGILHDDIILRDDFVERLQQYIQLQEEHLNAEESRIFPLLNRTLSPDDWIHLADSLPSRDDPLFGPLVACQYRNLYSRITSQPPIATDCP